jgi:poly-gamma-glutamate synthesis protein (capsule biosynthesis protein)
MLIFVGIFLAITGGIFLFAPQRISYIASNLKSGDDQASSTPVKTELLFVGDVMMGRNVELLMDQKGDLYPFEHISEFFKDSDMVVANLEGPVLSNHTRTPSQSFSFNFHTRIPGILRSHNIQIVSLANNHTYDHGRLGYEETAKHVKDAGILPVGHPFAFSDTYITRTTVGSQKFVLLGFNITNPNFDYAKAKTFVQGITKTSDEKLIAMVHGGEEYKLVSNASQKNFYRGLIDVGVDLIIAHHPHVVQEVELYKNKLIFYSLGNFIFDQYFSKDTQQGLTVKASFTKATTTYELIPVKSVRSQAMLMNEKEKTTFLNALANRSSKNIQELIKEGSIVVNN